jgi:putative DNA primase/helicase
MLNDFAEKVTGAEKQAEISPYLEKLLHSVLSEDQLSEIEIKPGRKFLGPIGEGTLGEIFGPRGIGKSWFKDVIAICLTRGMDLGPFICEHPASVLIVDGEMTLSLLKDRRKLLAKLPAALKSLDLISNEHLHSTFGSTVNLANEAWRDAFLEFIKASGDRWDVIIFDNLSSFLPGIKENDQEAWSPINTFLLQLRWLKKAIIFIHHAGKSGDQRGTSGREDALDYVIKLTVPPGYNTDEGCRFDATLTKSRSLTGPETAPFTFSIVEDHNGALTWSIKNLKESKKEIVIALLGNGVSQKEAGTIAGVNKAYVSRIRASAIRQGLLDNKGTTFTAAGRDKFGNFDVDRLVS